MKTLCVYLLTILTIDSIRAAQVDTAGIYSPAMRKTIQCLVIQPDDYSATGKPYPVLYLLHGWSGHFAAWLSDAPQLRQHADAHKMLIVCPDGGYDSWYLDSPVDSAVRYETHITREVTAYIDHYYNTRRTRGGRAIAGLSMGGHGALSIAIRHPEVFGAAGSMCGGLDLRPFKTNGWDLKGVLGHPRRHWKNWEDFSVINLASRAKTADLALMIDCGTGDFFYKVNQAMHQALLEAGAPHEYVERPGEHNDAYWSNAVDYQVVFFRKFFERESRGH
jgi:S-formylglutathione hydrolase FrmB